MCSLKKISFAGAFLIPFMVMLILEGIPLFLIELGVGQRMRLGALGVWTTIHPWLGGIGISSCIVTLFVAIYYNVIITWCLYYFINSFRVGQFSFFFSNNIISSYHNSFHFRGRRVPSKDQTLRLLRNVKDHQRRNIFGIDKHSTPRQA